MADELKIDLAPVTLASFEAACEALELDPDDVLTGEAAAMLDVEQAAAFARVVAPEAALPEPLAPPVAQALGNAFFEAVFDHVGRACERAERHAERCGVLGIGEDSGAPLTRVITRFGATEYRALREEMPLEDCMTYLMLRSVDHISANLKDYIG